MGWIGNAPSQGLFNGGQIVDGTVDTVDLKDSAVTAAKLAATAILDKLGYTPVDITTVTNAIAGKLDKTGGTLTGDLNTPGLFGKNFTMTSSAGSIAIIDTAINLNGSGIYEILVQGCPNANGSSSYVDVQGLLVTIGSGWNGTSVTKYINTYKLYNSGRSLYPSGSSQSVDVEATMLYNAVEYQSLDASTTCTLRLKVSGTSPVGAGLVAKVMRRL